MMPAARAAARPGVADFRHLALFYEGTDGFVAGTLEFVRDGLRAGEPVLVAAPPDRLAALRDALRADTSRADTLRADALRADTSGAGALGADTSRAEAAVAGVRLLDMTKAGRNPGRILPTVLIPFADAHPGRPVRIIGEPIWAERTALEYPVCVQHEALINSAFAGRDATILCPYDTSALRTAVIDDARTTHPYEMVGDTAPPCAEYADPWSVIESRNRPLADPPVYAVTMTVTSGGRPSIGHFVAERAYASGLVANRAEDAAEAARELAAVVVTGATVGAWAEDGHFVCQVNEPGEVGAEWRDARSDVLGGRRLEPVHRLADLVRVASAANGSTVRLYFRR